MADWKDYLGVGAVGGSTYAQSFLHPDKAYKKAEEAEQHGWDESQGYGRPFVQQGLEQYPNLNQATSNLLNPEALQNKWAEGYQNSPWANQLLSQNMSSGMDAASAMGLGGSSAALGNIQQGAGNIVASQRQQYMEDLMKKYMEGIGLGGKLYGTGATMANNLSARALQHGENMAGLEYGRVAAPGQLAGQVGGMAANVIQPGAGSAFNGTNNAGFLS